MKGVVLFYIASITFALGILLQSFFPLGLAEIALLLLLSLGVAILWRRKVDAWSSKILLCVSVALLFLAFGTFRFDLAAQHEFSPFFETRVGEEVELFGTIVREPDERESSTHLYIRTQDELLLAYVDRFGEYTYGDEVLLRGTITKPEPFETDLGRIFNYPGYLRSKGVHYIVSYAEVEVVGEGGGNAILSALLSVKHTFMHTIESLLPEPQVGLGEGLLLGVKRALGDELEQIFRQTGIIHIVVLSGYNVMLVVAFVTYILGALIPKRYALPFGLTAIACFALMVGLSATVVRASIMAALVLMARWLDRTYLVLRALMLAGIVMLLINPYLLAFDVGFQLSFMATLALIVVAPHIEARLTRVPKTIGMREFLTATLATQIFVMPILLYQIGEFSVVAVLVNVLVLPMVPVAMLLVFITGVVGFFSSTIGSFLALLTYYSLEYILVVASWFAALPFAVYVVPPFPFYLVVFSYGVIGFVLWQLSKKNSRVTNVVTRLRSFFY